MINRFVSPFLKPRLNAIARYGQDAEALQAKTLATLLHRAAQTQFGRDYGFGGLRGTDLESWHNLYKRHVPVLPYNDLKPYTDRMRRGEPDILWPGLVRNFSKSSGTTADKSKFIPVSR
ncbi:MAG: GH3 auxin-responsive promoter family protein, partial [Bacteroidales bacterium]|nr:GH3 auxin-responsive promoter family protein [Bacteroidales bacterium]